MPKLLTNEQILGHDRDGVVFPITVLTAGEVEDTRANLDRLKEAMGGHINMHQMRHLHLFHRWAYDLAIHPRVLDGVEDVLGPDILVHSTAMFMKYPRDATFVSWHQDGFYMSPSTLEFTSAWIALTRSSAENGCMRIVRGSHRDGMVHHTDDAKSPKNLLAGLHVAEEPDESRKEDVVLAPGEMSLHNVATLHGSNPNHSDTYRIGFAVRYMTPSVAVKIDHFPVIVARGTRPNPNFRTLLDPPSQTMEEAIEGQARLIEWVGASRSRSEPVPLPEGIGLRWQERAVAATAQ